MFLSLTKSEDPVAKNMTNIIDAYEIIFSMFYLFTPLSIKCFFKDVLPIPKPLLIRFQ